MNHDLVVLSIQNLLCIHLYQLIFVLNGIPKKKLKAPFSMWNKKDGKIKINGKKKISQTQYKVT